MTRIIVLLLAVLSLAACGRQDLITSPATEVIMTETPLFEESYKSQSEAYYKVFVSSAQSWGVPGKSDKTIIALDLSGMKLQDNSYFIYLAEGFCVDHDLTLLYKSFSDWGSVSNKPQIYIPVRSKEPIGDTETSKGIIYIAFNDEELTTDKLVTNVDIHVAPLAASGSRYIVEKKDDMWEITEFKLKWIS